MMSEAAAFGLALDLAPELTRAVTNVICSLCFNSSYCRGDPEFEAMLHYSRGIVETVAKDSLVDIFPWLQVSSKSAEQNQQDQGLNVQMREKQETKHLVTAMTPLFLCHAVQCMFI